MIIRRPGGYGVRVWDRATKRRRWLGTYPTLKEARLAEAGATLKPRRGKPVTVGEWARIWLSDYARPAAATQRTYRYAANQVMAAIGGMLLGDIDRPLARKLCRAWPRNTSRTARTMFGDAMRDGLLDFNPFSQLRLETPKGRKDLDALTEPQIHELAEIALHVHDDYGIEARAIVLTLGFIGVRPGELCALRRADLNPDKRELVVRYNLDAAGNEKAPKNNQPRTITVPPVALEAIAMVEPHASDDLIFHTPRGRQLNKGSLTYLWRPIATTWKERTRQHVTPHHLRHAAATLLVERGVQPADVAVQLGHSDGGRLVATLYAHPSEDRARDRLKMAFADADTDAIMEASEKRPGDAGTSPGMAQKG